MKKFRELKVWQQGHQLVLDLYKISGQFPRDELFGLTSQTRRAAASIPANIAEGCGRDTDPELRRYLTIAFGSASELEYHLLLAHDLGYLKTDAYSTLQNQLESIKRMLHTFIQKLKAES